MRAPARTTSDPLRDVPSVHVGASGEAPTWALVVAPVAFGAFLAMFAGAAAGKTAALVMGGVGAVGGYLLVRDSYSIGA